MLMPLKLSEFCHIHGSLDLPIIITFDAGDDVVSIIPQFVPAGCARYQQLSIDLDEHEKVMAMNC